MGESIMAEKTIKDPNIENGFEGMYLGIPDLNMAFSQDPFPYDFHAAAKYVREHNLPAMTKEVMALFKY